MKNKWQSTVLLALKGAAMGVAEVIPGVSGGTLAFITGIYEKLIETIKTWIGPDLFRTLRREGWRTAWERSNALFLFNLLIGMAIGVIAGVFGVSHLLENYPVLLWSFFFGLIIASALYIGRRVTQWKAGTVAALVLGTAVAYWITVANPGRGSDEMWFVFISGAIAISALILPGISGSFILLLMGMYTTIIPTVKRALETFETQSLVVLLVFALGCLVGLGTFSRLLSWTFKRYHNLTLAVLTGFMLGSLNKIWPWRNVIEYRTNSRGEREPFIEHSVLPAQYEGEPMFWGAILLILVGFASVFLIEWMGNRGTGAGKG